jgi:flagellar biosynthesis protein FlhB
MALKTHEPTPGRLRRAQRQGDLPVSSLASRSVGFAIGVLLLPATLATLGLRCLDAWRHALTQPHDATVLLGQLLSDVTITLVPWLAAIVLATGLSTLLQTSGYFSVQPLAPQADRLRPDRAWMQLLRSQHWLTVLLALTTAALLASVGAYFVLHHLPSFGHSAQRPLATVPLALWVLQHFAWAAAALGLLAGIADWLLRRAAWQERQRMTHAEWLEEQKNSYGDPALRAEIKRLQREQLTE